VNDPETAVLKAGECHRLACVTGLTRFLFDPSPGGKDIRVPSLLPRHDLTPRGRFLIGDSIEVHAKSFWTVDSQQDRS